MYKIQQIAHMRDEICNQIIFYFYTRPLEESEPLNYNVLLKHLNEEGFRMSRPTLSLHLKHLERDGVLKRTEISRKNVTYELSEPNENRRREKAESYKIFETYLTDMYTRNRYFTIEEKIRHLSLLGLFSAFYELRADIIDLIDPKKQYDYRVDADYYRNCANFYSDNIREEIKDRGNVYGENIILEMENFLKNLYLS